jgi:hypothetical protein
VDGIEIQESRLGTKVKDLVVVTKIHDKGIGTENLLPIESLCHKIKIQNLK